MQSPWKALRYTYRSFLKSPGFVAVAILSIALGTAATTTVFSWMQSLLLNPLGGVKDGNHLVTLETMASGEFVDSSYPDFKDYRDRARSLSGVIAFKDAKVAMGESDDAKWVNVELVSGNFFDVLGVEPRVGRFFVPEEQKEVLSGAAVAVISEKLWEDSFNSSRQISGKTVKINGYPFTIVGVAPKNFKGNIVGAGFDVWLPLMMVKEVTGSNNAWLNMRGARPLHLMARLAPNATLSEANREITNIALQIEHDDPANNQGTTAILLPLWKAPYGAQTVLRTLLGVLMGVAVVVLLIVCSNVANLLLIRAVTRQKEISTRLALGASRRQIVMQLLMESLVLSTLGTVAGLICTFACKDLLRLMIPPTEKPFALTARIDGTVLLFSLLLAVVVAILFGLAPALQATKVDLAEALNQGGRGGSYRKSGLRSVFVVSSVAFGLVATIGAGLFLESFKNAKRTDIGFDTDHVLLVGLNLSQGRLSREKGAAFYKRLREGIQALPGVRAVSYSEDVPLGFGGGSWDEVAVDGYQPQYGESTKVYRNSVAPGYFDLMHIPLVQGRDFTDADDGKNNVMIVNETFAKRYFGSSIPLGRIVRVWGQPVTIIGVVKDLKYRSLQEPPQPYMYYSFAEAYRATSALHVKTVGNPTSLLPEINRKIKEADPNISIVLALTLEDYVGASFYSQKMAAVLLSILGGVGLLLAILGVYGVTAYSVNQRTREFGIRMALGAQRYHIIANVLRQGLVLAAAGVVVGLVATAGVSRVVASVLFGVSATNPAILLFASAAMVLAVLLASLVPSQKATRIDPLEALRVE